MFTEVFSTFCLQSIIFCLALNWGEMFRIARSSFSHLTFREADIMLEKIFCKSMKTALFINPFFDIRPYFSPFPLALFAIPSSCFIEARLVVYPWGVFFFVFVFFCSTTQGCLRGAMIPSEATFCKWLQL